MPAPTRSASTLFAASTARFKPPRTSPCRSSTNSAAQRSPSTAQLRLQTRSLARKNSTVRRCRLLRKTRRNTREPLLLRYRGRLLLTFADASRVIAKRNFRNGGRRLQVIAANRQVCPTISEITFGNLYIRTKRRRALAKARQLRRERHLPLN